MIKNFIYIANSRIPTTKAHGFQIMKMCEAFSNAGVELELWVPGRFNPIKESPFAYYNIRETFKIRKFFVIDLIPLSKYLGRVANFIESVSFVIFLLPALLRIQTGIFYSRDQFAGRLLSFLGKKFVYEIHVFPKNPWLHKKVWNKAHKIVAITNGLKNLLINQGVAPEKIMIVPDAVDLDFFEAINTDKNDLRIELNLPKEDFIVGYVGRFKTLEMEKGIKTMIEALPLLDKDVKMVFVGGEESEINSYKILANRFNVFSQVLFFSRRPYIEAVKYMKTADVLVIPSPNQPFYAIYSSPLKLFEYMASGRPIIASDLPALREILNDKNALFFKPENVEDLARTIKMLKSSQMLGYHLSQQALADVKKYTWANRAKNIIVSI